MDKQPNPMNVFSQSKLINNLYPMFRYSCRFGICMNLCLNMAYYLGKKRGNGDEALSELKLQHQRTFNTQAIGHLVYSYGFTKLEKETEAIELSMGLQNIDNIAIKEPIVFDAMSYDIEKITKYAEKNNIILNTFTMEKGAHATLTRIYMKNNTPTLWHFDPNFGVIEDVCNKENAQKLMYSIQQVYNPKFYEWFPISYKN
ncbi:hypothetical protein [Vibrio nigripulchritudo]|uniref:hypothetical protein n=1 Tax=Vibrio nigripulchritudo TaxID=28173 RepID=UPI0003B19CCD|nr:hypothetical protein [Vibrio nigripulchritudo]CCN70201.1 hypothetical protein VIBNISFn118_1890003 [Vibrio nigripulchritudo SFn118]